MSVHESDRQHQSFLKNSVSKSQAVPAAGLYISTKYSIMSVQNIKRKSPYERGES